MSSRLHSKYHRHNHHTKSDFDPRYPDASHDPIASYDSPFLGDFVMVGGLLSAVPALPDDVAVRADGIISAKTIATDEISFTGDIITTFSDPITATGEFLIVKIQGEQRGIRLWDSDKIRSYPN